MRCEPLKKAVSEYKDSINIYTSPCGKKWTQKDAERLAASDKSINFICGRFGGVDQRFLNKYIHETYSLGDFVVSGGELPSLMILDSIVRLTPGAMSDPQSSYYDSFSPGCLRLLEHELYTQPQVFEDLEVPKVLLSGHHQKIKEWKEQNTYHKTKRLRPDLLPKE